jgi:hypothetical protein
VHGLNHGQENLRTQEMNERQQLIHLSGDFQKTEETLELGLKEF